MNAHYTVEAGRLICKDGVPLFTINRKDALSILEADALVLKLATLLNIDATVLGSKSDKPCAMTDSSGPEFCQRCGSGLDSGYCAESKTERRVAYTLSEPQKALGKKQKK